MSFQSYRLQGIRAVSDAACFLAGLLVFLGAVHAGDWPHWRGPLRNGITKEVSGWNGEAWNRTKQWEFQAGEGSSSAVVVSGCVYLTGWSSNRDTIYCLDLSSGKEIWRQTYDSPRYGRHAVGDQQLYSGACSTPEYDARTGYLFTLSSDGDLHAWDTRNRGTSVWSVNIYDKYEAPRRPEVAERKKTRRDYGYVSSALALDGQLIVEAGGKSGNLVAFDPRDGKELWTSQNRDEAGHTGGPVPMTVDGVACVAVLTLRNVVVTQIEGNDAGRTVATFPWTTDYGNNIASAAVHGDSVIITSSYNQAAMCRLRITGEGAEVVWRQEGIASGVCTPVIRNGKIYWAWRGVHCVDFATGQEIWRGGKIGSQGSCILTSDERLIVYGNKGDLLLVDTATHSPDVYRELSRASIFSATDAWPHVVLSEQMLICRDRSGHVACFSTASETDEKL